MLYELKLKVKQLADNGEEKEVVERYITDVTFFAEAEAKGMEQYNGECDVFAITQSKIIEIVNKKEDDKPFFKATIIKEYTDDSGNEKEMKYPVLVCAKDITEANKLMQDYMRQGLEDMRLDAIQKTKILDIL